ncbi:MAG: hypothetical protein F4041_13960 [Acidobacteriia bacterium]|nr:hypothetical protein [Terriglobia bacterium]
MRQTPPPRIEPRGRRDLRPLAEMALAAAALLFGAAFFARAIAAESARHDSTGSLIEAWRTTGEILNLAAAGAVRFALVAWLPSSLAERRRRQEDPYSPPPPPLR